MVVDGGGDDVVVVGGGDSGDGEDVLPLPLEPPSAIHQPPLSLIQ